MFFDFYVSVFDEIFVGYYGRLFTIIDTNNDGHISDIELRAFIVGIQFEEYFDLDPNAVVNKIMNDFDTSGNSCIDENEFVNGISRWLNKAKPAAVLNAGRYSIKKFINDFRKVKIVLFQINRCLYEFLEILTQQIKRERDLLDVGGSVKVEAVKKSKWASIKAVLLLLPGTIIAPAFAYPLVDTIDNLADATSIPAFFHLFHCVAFGY